MYWPDKAESEGLSKKNIRGNEDPPFRNHRGTSLFFDFVPWARGRDRKGESKMRDVVHQNIFYLARVYTKEMLSIESPS